MDERALITRSSSFPPLLSDLTINPHIVSYYLQLPSYTAMSESNGLLALDSHLNETIPFANLSDAMIAELRTHQIVLLECRESSVLSQGGLRTMDAAGFRRPQTDPPISDIIRNP
jgi:hypothetical protein